MIAWLDPATPLADIEAILAAAAAARDALSQTGLGIANGNPGALAAVAT